MRSIHPIVHSIARPIRVAEFVDALRATCTPRFPGVRGTKQRAVGVAVSGGVDSMVLAYLCSQVHRAEPTNFKITDNFLSSFRCFVVDHGLREGSGAEAEAVKMALEAMGYRAAFVLCLDMTKDLGSKIDSKHIPNLESVARRSRYRMLAHACIHRKIASLLVGHHQDDQYETVLMRLLSGYCGRGLRGMRPANGIPECEGIMGAYQSGWVDDQEAFDPFYNLKPSRRQRRVLREEFMVHISEQMGDWANSSPEGSNLDPNESLELPLIPIEQGGVSIYRPLLEFSKARLIATCLHNNIPWWEDHTNADPSLTMRNSLRYMFKNHKLPEALQKPAILRLSQNWQDQIRAQDAEAERLLQRTNMYDLNANAGTLIVQFPDIQLPRPYARKASVIRYRRRLKQKRVVAGLMIQKIIALVSPGLQATPLANLQNVISRLLPGLSSNMRYPGCSAAKPFAVAGVHFLPIKSTPRSIAAAIPTHPRTWYLSRAPYTSNLPTPTSTVPRWALIQENHKRAWSGAPWRPWHFWDGRYWIRILLAHWSHMLPIRVVVQPFRTEHAKAFRDSLLPKDRDELAVALKRVTPGKVRYTLPAIYVEGDVDVEDLRSRGAARKRAEKECYWPVDATKKKLLALPTLGFELPGLDDWLSYDIRYKCTDNVVTMAGHFNQSRGCFVAPGRKKRTTTSGIQRVSRVSRTQASREGSSRKIERRNRAQRMTNAEISYGGKDTEDNERRVRQPP